jgi:hypothetical protein
MTLKLQSGRNYRVKVTPDKIASGRNTILQFELLSPEGKRVTDLEIVHEKLLHLLLVSNDLSWFAHEHPRLQPDGTLVLEQSFPHGGQFTLYHDFTPARVGMQVVPVELSVLGDTPPTQPLKLSAAGAQDAGNGYTVQWVSNPPFRSLSTQRLRLKVMHDGQPVSDLEPYLGALGHLIVISQDRKHFVHSHPLPTDKQTGAAQPTGPEVIFNALFPTPSLYKAWTQFQHRGRVITAPFVFEVVSPLAAHNGSN